METSRNIRLLIAYDGTDFYGWQRQNGKRTVQGEIEKALAGLHGKKVSLTGSGRTDSGVHAVGQVANFYTCMGSIPPDRFSSALNSFLPPDVRILESKETDAAFHSRFSAVTRTYRYHFLCGRQCLPHERLYNLRLNRIPNLRLLNGYCMLLSGETNCSIFAASPDKSKSKNRYIFNNNFQYDKNCLVYEISANAFLMKMVRSIAGTFLYYEEKLTPVEKMREIITSGRRSLAGPTLPPQGLFLWEIFY
ncbi:MAG: tRNA pseudouridine(38-40) synthase TruA [Treponema sp.]|jgi:tRNA pseudouridine38-40 synthase|nr:tRNA pseudouridine(38-40) synthase TruA [Treponema sp.]